MHNCMSTDKNIFNKNEGRCMDVKTQKACKQDWEVNIVPKIKYLHRYKAKYRAVLM